MKWHRLKGDKSMKSCKWLSFFLALVMIFSFTGCRTSTEGFSSSGSLADLDDIDSSSSLSLAESEKSSHELSSSQLDGKVEASEPSSVPAPSSSSSQAPVVSSSKPNKPQAPAISSSKPNSPSSTAPSSKPKPPAPDPKPQGNMVWISKTGKKYHSTPSCSNMKNPSQVSLETAKARGFTACKKCW